MKKALIFGSQGQDGRCLSDLLLSKNYFVHGVHRQSGIDLLDESSVSKLIQDQAPDEIYYLAAHHHSSEQVLESELLLWKKSFETHVHIPNVILESIRKVRPETKFFYASSSLVFGVGSGSLSEVSILAPDSPYGITKASGMALCHYYRNQYQLFISVGILFNHETEFRKPQFLSKKVARAIRAIQNGSQEKLKLGNLNAEVDWGYGRDYVLAMHQILNLPEPDTFVIASGQLHSVQEWVERSFRIAGLHSKDWIETDSSLLQRKIPSRCGDFSKLKAATGWTPQTSFDTMLEILLKSEGVTIAQLK